jgi:hypothetical protein
MTNDDFNPAIEEEASDSGQGRPILKIPSYKPAGSAPGPSKNGAEAGTLAFPQGFNAVPGSPALLERASPAFSGTSSPTNSLVGKGMAVNFRDVIAKSISVKFQEGQTPAGIPGELIAGAIVIRGAREPAISDLLLDLGEPRLCEGALRRGRLRVTFRATLPPSTAPHPTPLAKPVK